MRLVLHSRDADGTVRSVIRSVAEGMGLDLLEIRQDLLERPACIASGCPIVEVRALAADIDQCIDRAAAALHFPTRYVHVAPAELLFGLGVVHPVGLFIVVSKD